MLAENIACLLLDSIQTLMSWLHNFFPVLTFGFEPVVYSVSEGIGSVNLGVFFISGDAGEFVPHLNASTIDGTATGNYFIELVAMQL